MNLLIHDFSKEEWDEISKDYEGWEIISDNNNIHPCCGCFNCWLKTPGECAIKDGYDHMGKLINEADEIVIMSKFTYGGFSSFVKNVLDRSIGYILPFFRIYKGKMHHKPRYPKSKSFQFIFRGHDLTEDDKARARKYVEAVCTNFNAKVSDVQFIEVPESEMVTGIDTVGAEIDAVNREGKLNANAINVQKGKTLLVNCSMRREKANSKKFLDVIEKRLTERVGESDLVCSDVISKTLTESILSAEKIVLAMPLYVDGIPSAPLKVMEELEKMHAGAGRKIYVVANMGFYESCQLENLLGMVRSWCHKSGFEYCGGIAIGAGEMMGSVINYGSNGPGKYVYDAILKLADAVYGSEHMDDIYTRSNKFPRFLYFMAANYGMRKSGKEKGLTKAQMNHSL